MSMEFQTTVYSPDLSVDKDNQNEYIICAKEKVYVLARQLLSEVFQPSQPFQDHNLD